MTALPIVTRERVAAQFREAGKLIATALAYVLFGIGWTLVKTCRAIATAIGAMLFTVGWFGGRVIWPALRWSADAVKLGWQQGAKPAGGRRGPA